MRKTIDGIHMLKTCPNCDVLIPIADMTCPHCGYIYEPTVLSEEEAAWSYDETVEMINDAFFRLEHYGAGKTSKYEAFGFGWMFSVLFEKTRIPQNQKLKNFKRIDQYYALTGQLATDFDKGGFENREAYKNQDFIDDLNEITYLNSGRYWEFMEFEVPNKKDRLSITDMMEDDLVFKDLDEARYQLQKEPSLNDHFDRIRSCEITDLEQYNLAEKLTDNFKLDKLKLLYDDLDFYLFVEKEEMEALFSEEEIEEAMKNWINKGMTIPTHKMPVLRKKGELADPDEKPIEILDKERLLFSAEFFCCYKFKNLLKSKIAAAEGAMQPEIARQIKVDKLKGELRDLGFFELEQIAALLPRQQNDIVKLIESRDIPFTLALLQQLGLPDQMSQTITKTKTALHKKLAELLNCPERTIKGNINVLNAVSMEDRTRYTAHLHIEEVNKILSDLK